MQLSNFIWSLYAKSRRGKKAINACNDMLANTDPGPSDLDKEELQIAYEFYKMAFAKKVRSSEGATALYEHMLDTGITVDLKDGRKKYKATFGGNKDGHELWLREIHPISFGLSLAHPSYFTPYFFQYRLNRLGGICTEFDIAIPVLPGKASWRERALFYARLNESLQEFRRIHSMAPAELCAFLYYFAQEHLSAKEEPLPPAAKAWLIMGGTGGNGDFEFVDSADDASSHYWQGNLETRRGDILVMWCVSPRSYVHSIWRATSDGFVDPFFHYHSTIWVGSPIKTPPITFKELAANPVWSQKPAVRAHFQGASGKSITSAEYDALLKMIARKKFDVSGLPRLRTPTLQAEVDVELERDVEEQFVEPLLKELGYTERDWVRGMSIRMGRGERVYSDYAVGVAGKRGDESALMVVEAKLRLASPRQLEDAYYQAKSYALRLQARVIALAAQEGLWVFLQDRGAFSFERSIHKTWGEVRTPDTIHELTVMIGKRSRTWA